MSVPGFFWGKMFSCSALMSKLLLLGILMFKLTGSFVICNQSDIASECVNPHDSRYIPERILLYDPRPGGTGISRKVNCGASFIVSP